MELGAAHMRMKSGYIEYTGSKKTGGYRVVEERE